jgi:hypothetical protein
MFEGFFIVLFSEGGDFKVSWIHLTYGIVILSDIMLKITG